MWRCKWDDWSVIAGLMLGNQSLSGLDINKHPSNCLIFFLIPPSQLALTNKATTIRIEQWYHLKKNPGEVELIAWYSLCEPEENTVVWGGFVCARGDLHSFAFFSPFLPSISLSFPLAEEHAVVDGDIITQ